MRLLSLQERDLWIAIHAHGLGSRAPHAAHAIGEMSRSLGQRRA
jgi:hypothetical protein